MEMTRRVGSSKWLGTTFIAVVVSAAMIMIPEMQRPAHAQQGWAPPPQPMPGQPYYAPPPVDAARASAEAMTDAHADTNGTLWYFAGCLLGVIGILIAYVSEPSPPPARMMGKSPEYLAIYTNTYKAEARSIQGRSAIYGALTTVVVVVALWVIIVVAVAKSTPTYYAPVLPEPL
jgi:hypothetical protein